VTYGHNLDRSRIAAEFGRELIEHCAAVADLLRRAKPWHPAIAAPVAAEPDVIKQYEVAGADGIVVFVMPAAEQEMLAELEQIAAKIIG
jgi:hypothetical protein